MDKHLMVSILSHPKHSKVDATVLPSDTIRNDCRHSFIHKFGKLKSDIFHTQDFPVPVSNLSSSVPGTTEVL